ncbi:HAMP domain-containing sensor histidine kinase [Streptomyces sp. HUAS TT20]|uniref:HAMP domain-containing sensor histidine kinase n=1 Tax=Streptomyces sp. HUAS TT20 TaxID=3447509 RepID=UPI0021D9B7E2|nr:HAMP domain-containing sensor histidine kinase [Streptomyces sp. HUAS 15-9]UXY32191.1 HAMP domain-containing histidine kinase [Streptomyces sp. HUAS 15-9]
MNLRARLALALAALTALSVVAAGWVNYEVTERRLYEAVDTGLKGFAAAVTSGATDSAICPGGRSEDAGGVGIASLPPVVGVPDIVECVHPDGQVTSLFGSEGVRLRQPAAGVDASGGLRGPWTETAGGHDYRVMVIELAGSELRIARSLAETHSVLASVRARSATAGLAIIVLAAGAGVLIARWTSRPVTRLTSTAEAIATTGDLGIDVPTGRRDEVGRLARAFAEMLGALTRSREQQQELVQNAGHELRTPLTSVRSNVDTLRHYPELNEGLRDRVLSDLDSELRELSALVDELVALAVDQYEDEDEQHVDLADLVERAAERARRRSDRRIVVDATPARVVAKPGQLLRAVGNLLDNAVKFTPRGTPIEVTVRPGRIDVRDHGPGIDPADLPHVFDRFYRAVDARAVTGSGLGLAIAQQIVHQCGGTIRAANHPDGGALFTLQLAAAPRTAPPD